MGVHFPLLAKYLKTKNKRVSGASKKAWGLPPHTPAKRSTLDRNSLRGHSPCGRGSKPSLLPCGNSVGRSIPSRVEINGLRPPLTAFSLLGNPPQAFFPLSLSRSAHLYTNLRWYVRSPRVLQITKCALILNKKLSVRPTGFLQNSNLSKQREM